MSYKLLILSPARVREKRRISSLARFKELVKKFIIKVVDILRSPELVKIEFPRLDPSDYLPSWTRYRDIGSQHRAC